MSTTSTYAIPTDQSTISAITGSTAPMMAFAQPLTTSAIIQPMLEISAPFPGLPLPNVPQVDQFNPGADPEGNLSAIPAFWGGVGSDIFTGQQGDGPGNFIGAGGSETYSQIAMQSQGTGDWTTVGTDMNNGSEKQAFRDMAAAIQRDLNGLPLQTPPGNAAVGMVKLATVGGVWCYAAVGAAGLTAAAAAAKSPVKLPVAIMMAAATATATWYCEQRILNPDPDEMAAYDAILHSASMATQEIGDMLNEASGGGGPLTKGAMAVGSASTSIAGAPTAAGWNLTSTGATVDWTKSLIDPVSHHAVNFA